MLWRRLKELKECQPWVIMGDFNEILFAEDRIGRKANSRPGKDFIDFVEYCGMEDIMYSGSRYTWNNKRSGEQRICSKSDRVMEGMYGDV